MYTYCYFNPDPNSSVNCRSWQLMAITASTLSPANTRVQKYVLCHLKKCSLDTTTEEGKFARFSLKVCILAKSLRYERSIKKYVSNQIKSYVD